MVELTSGNVRVAFQAGTTEKAPDSSIWTAVRDRRSAAWSPVRVMVASAPVQTCLMNSVLNLNPEGRLLLSVHRGGGPEGHCIINNWEPHMTYSDDEGETWRPLQPFPGGCMGATKNQCVRLSNGETLCGSSIESEVLDTAHLETVDDNWEHCTPHANVSCIDPVTHGLCDMIHPLVFETSRPGELFALFRTGCGIIAQGRSMDYGHTWPKIADQSVFNNAGAGFGGTTLKGTLAKVGWLLGVNNNSMVEGGPPLILVHSSDEGASWNHLLDIETTPNGYFGYPFILQSRIEENLVHLCYSYENTYEEKHLQTIAYAQLRFILDEEVL